METVILKRRTPLGRLLYSPLLFWRTWRIGRGHVPARDRLCAAWLSARLLLNGHKGKD